MLSLLAQSDYRVHELVEQHGPPMNLVSYHLGKLRGSDLVHERRSSADGRDVYYSLDLARMRTLLHEAGMQLHPSLCAQADAPCRCYLKVQRRSRVLFLCTRNSARSQMAEGMLRHLGGDAVQAYSAGDDPGASIPTPCAPWPRWTSTSAASAPSTRMSSTASFRLRDHSVRLRP